MVTINALLKEKKITHKAVVFKLPITFKKLCVMEIFSPVIPTNLVINGRAKHF